MNREELNSFYKALLDKVKTIMDKFKGSPFKVSYKMVSNHYSKNDNGVYEMDYYPIPIITISTLADIYLNVNEITVASILKRDDSLKLDYTIFSGYFMEAYGVKDFDLDFYTKGSTLDSMKKKIEESNEIEIGHSFTFGINEPMERIDILLSHLINNKFYI